MNDVGVKMHCTRWMVLIWLHVFCIVYTARQSQPRANNTDDDDDDDDDNWDSDSDSLHL